VVTVHLVSNAAHVNGDSFAHSTYMGFTATAANDEVNRWLAIPNSNFDFHLVIPDNPNQVVERPEIMAAAALALCSQAPQRCTGRIAHSQTLLAELGIPVPVAASDRR
jgi:hypothetical protein